MSTQEPNNGCDYAEKAFRAFQKIMSSRQKNMLENMNRANKGERFVLHFLAMRNEAVLPSELSAALHASTARISALLGTLEKKGHLVRNIDKSNRRNILVSITEAGRHRAETEMCEMKRKMTHVFIEMGETDTAEFLRLTDKFITLMQKHPLEEESKNQGK